MTASIPGILLALAGCGSGAQDVKEATAGPRDINATTGGLGTVAAAVDLPVAFNIAGLKAPVQVEEVKVTLGAHVTVGQPLVSIIPTPLTNSLQALQVTLLQAQAEQAGVQARLNTARPDQADALRAQLQAVTARVALDRQLVSIATGAQPVITSPIAGDVAAVNVVAGQSVSPGRPFVEIVDASRIQVTATLPISDLALATVGAPAQLTFAELPDVHLHAAVIGRSPTATNGGLGFQVLVSAPNTPDGQALPGLKAYVQLSAVVHATVAVPRLAINNIDRDPSVFVVHGDTVTLQSIHVGAADDTYAQVSGGLKAGDLVVTVGHQTLDNGSKVHVTGTD